MAIEKQIWIEMLMEGFYPNRSFLNRSIDMSALVEYNKINLAEAGVSPDVLIDNKDYPVGTMSREDTPLELPLHTFDTKNTVVRNVEEKETSYAKMDSVIRQHRQTLQAKTSAYAAHSWAPSANKELAPVKTTDSSGKISFEDVLKMDAWFRQHDVDPETMVAVLNPYHLADLQLDDMKLYKAMLDSNRLFGFTVFTFSQLPYYSADGAKLDFGGTVTDTHQQSSLFYSDREVMRADGDIEVFAKYKDPEQRGDVIGFQKRFTALSIRGKYQAVIYNKA